MKKTKVFISYAREDGEAARRLCEDLRRRNRDVWFDRDSIKGGERWRIAIEKAIRACDFFVALLSDVSIGKRGMVQSEIRKALDVLEELPEDEVYLIPVRLVPCEPRFSRLNELHWIDLFPNWEDGVEQVVRSTELVAGEADKPDTKTPFDDIARSWSEKRSIPEEPRLIRVGELVRMSVDRFLDYARSRNIEIRFRDEAPSARVRISRTFAMNAFSNILSNAIKYSFTYPNRPSWISIATRITDDIVEIGFENWGIGISRKDLESGRLFQPGFRGKEAFKSAPLGAGLGLYLAKIAIDASRGDIRVESRPARSLGTEQEANTPFVTCVTVRLPIARATAQRTV